MTDKQQAIEDLHETLDSLSSRDAWRIFNKLTLADLLTLSIAIDAKLSEKQEENAT